MALSFLVPSCPTTVAGIVVTAALSFLAYQALVIVYNIFLHPLSRIPGPITCRASNIPYARQNVKGQLSNWIVQLHEQYGEVVRVAPNDVSFSSAEAYKEIYGFKRTGQATYAKDLRFYRSPEDSTHDIMNADDVNHARMRKAFSNAFSDRALKLQEPLFLTHIDKLLKSIRQNGDTDQDLVRLYNFTMFDIMGDLTFGENLGMLDSSDYHPWVAAILGALKFGVYLHTVRMLFPPLESFVLGHCIPESARAKMKAHNEFTQHRVDARLARQEARPDIWGLVVGKDEHQGMSRPEMHTNAKILMFAGTETTATLLSGLTYYLLSNPTKYEKLVAEIRGALATESDITVERLQALEYLHACLEEGLRMYPPVPQGLPRIVQPGPPAIVDSHEIAAGSVVRVSNLAALRNANNFRDPYEFVPERWLPNTAEGARYASDKKHALQSFSLGPRACLGRNMAYHEMRLILTKVLYNFDMTLCEESRQWNQQKTMILWQKPQLMVRLQPRRP